MFKSVGNVQCFFFCVGEGYPFVFGLLFWMQSCCVVLFFVLLWGCVCGLSGKELLCSMLWIMLSSCLYSCS